MELPLAGRDIESMMAVREELLVAQRAQQEEQDSETLTEAAGLSSINPEPYIPTSSTSGSEESSPADGPQAHQAARAITQACRDLAESQRLLGEAQRAAEGSSTRVKEQFERNLADLAELRGVNLGLRGMLQAERQRRGDAQAELRDVRARLLELEGRVGRGVWN